ncbi:NUDIX domain-containing protein [Patescibacteria group bacterium]
MRASAIIVKDGKVLLMHRKKDGEEYWVFPGGGIEEDETPEIAIKREVLEETSLKVTDCSYSFDYLDDEKVAHPVFVCSVEKGEPKLGGPEAEKHSEEDWYHPEWISLEDAVKLNVYPEEGVRVLQNLLP